VSADVAQRLGDFGGVHPAVCLFQTLPESFGCHALPYDTSKHKSSAGPSAAVSTAALGSLDNGKALGDADHRGVPDATTDEGALGATTDERTDITP
jgi:hypothetical protein